MGQSGEVGRNRERGSQIVELALILPLLLIFTAGSFDFGNAFVERDKLANAAREGARIASQQNFINLVQNGSSAAPSSDVKAIAQSVFAYLQYGRMVRGCTLDAGANSGAFSWTFGATGCPDTLSIKIERANPVVVAGSNILTTRVTVTYPARIVLFHRVIRLAVPTATYSNSFTITAVAIMRNVA